MTIEEKSNAIERALQDLNDFKNYEADYGKINKLINIINNYADLHKACRLMAERIAADENRSRDEVLEEFYEKAAADNGV